MWNFDTGRQKEVVQMLVMKIKLVQCNKERKRNDCIERTETDSSTEAHANIANPTTPKQVGETLVVTNRVGKGTANR